MHRLAAIPGGWSPNADGVPFVEQAPGDVIFLSASDSELASMQQAFADLAEEWGKGSPVAAPAEPPTLRCCNLVHFGKEATVDAYVEDVVEKAKLVVLRLIGGSAYYPHLTESVRLACHHRGIPSLFLPGHGAPDVDLMSLGTLPLSIAHQAWNFFEAGGRANLKSLLSFLLRHALGHPLDYSPPKPHPDLFLHHPAKGILGQEDQEGLTAPGKPVAALLAYRTHLLGDNVEPLESLRASLEKMGFQVLLVYARTFRERSIHRDLWELLTDGGRRRIDMLINTAGFAMHSPDPGAAAEFLPARLNVPMLQAVLASSTEAAWREGLFGLNPSDVAMNVVLPEMDGRIITRAIAFKRSLGRNPSTDSDLIAYGVHEPGCEFVAALAAAWNRLQVLANGDKRVAVILPNYPNKDGRLANGVGLDTPASCVAVLQALRAAGYSLGESLPENSAELMDRLTRGPTHDLDSGANRPSLIHLDPASYEAALAALSSPLRTRVQEQWGPKEDSPHWRPEGFPIAGFLLGKVFVGLQPSRGYDQDPQAIYHAPDLPPPHAYLACYAWLQQVFRADAVVHLGKHGNLEWLPGKSLAPDGSSCFPAALFGALPHFYPFIVNDPGEGSQAKRRNQAVILDHLIPPMTRAETYGELTRLEHLIDEYYEAFTLDPRRSALLKKSILDLVEAQHLRADLDLPAGPAGEDVDELLVRLDRYLCEVKEAQIRDGLHILGRAPEGAQLADLLMALHRIPTGGNPGVTQAMAADLGIGLDPLTVDLAEPYRSGEGGQEGGEVAGRRCRTAGDAVEALEAFAKAHLEKGLRLGSTPVSAYALPRFSAVLERMLGDTLARVRETPAEIANLLRGLEGRYVPAGPSGAPTRGRLDALPTGRNFYSVDVRTIPTEAAYRLGSRSATLLVERHVQEHGEYPRSVGLSVWGTSCMRTGGDDLAQALALLGVIPVWEGANRRVIDFEIIPLIKLGRPRVDVTLRISGFFRDAFPDSISLFQSAVDKVAAQEEPLDQNPIRAHFLRESRAWRDSGLEPGQAEEKALHRVFGCKPGAYGTGMQQVLDERNWTTAEDLALLYVQWGGYAYGPGGKSSSAHEAFRRRLGNLDIVMHNQDNREHDILDSDDYYQFQGGMVNASTVLKGKAPAAYFGDHARPESPRVKSLKEELLKVYRSRAINPKWMEGMRRHGYKGAFEMAATMDYLFAYGATTGLVEDFMYRGLTEAYLFDADNRRFLEASNPWALKDMAERMLEAVQRGLWKEPDAGMVQALKDLLLAGEGHLEGRI